MQGCCPDGGAADRRSPADGSNSASHTAFCQHTCGSTAAGGGEAVAGAAAARAIACDGSAGGAEGSSSRAVESISFGGGVFKGSLLIRLIERST